MDIWENIIWQKEYKDLPGSFLNNFDQFGIVPGPLDHAYEELDFNNYQQVTSPKQSSAFSELPTSISAFCLRTDNKRNLKWL